MKVEVIREHPKPPPIKEIVLTISISDLFAFRDLIAFGRSQYLCPTDSPFILATQILHETAGLYK